MRETKANTKRQTRAGSADKRCKKPSLDEFTKAVGNGWGSKSSVARLLGVARSTVGDWIAGDEEFRRVANDARGRTVDQIVGTMILAAVGIPERDDKGNIVGWVERPDTAACRYLLETMGKADGWGADDTPAGVPQGVEQGVDIAAWIRRECQVKEGGGR